MSCGKQSDNENQPPMKQSNILFLHHSTGANIWYGEQSGYIAIIKRKISNKSAVTSWFKSYNKENNTDHKITEQAFPKKTPYGWKNYPFDYYNIWVKNAGNVPYQEEPTLEMLTKDYDVIMWKHCYPVGNIKADTGNPDINSEEKTLANYMLQYDALKTKMREFPDTKFIVWTGAALVKSWTDEEQAKRTRQFFDWVRSEWDEPGDNIYLWDLYELETEGGLYLNEAYAMSPNNPHPNSEFSGKASKLLCQRVVDIIENDGSKTALTGAPK
jgi:hypothetical protein